MDLGVLFCNKIHTCTSKNGILRAKSMARRVYLIVSAGFTAGKIKTLPDIRASHCFTRTLYFGCTDMVLPCKQVEKVVPVYFTMLVTAARPATARESPNMAARV